MIKVVVVDDQPLMRDGLATILSLQSDIEIVGLANDGEEAFHKASELEPDIILMDIRMPRMNGVEGTKKICEAFPFIRVLMLTTFSDTEYILEALENGASGYLLKDMPTDTIVQAIKTVHSGGVVLPKELTNELFSHKEEIQKQTDLSVPSELNLLTEREVEVLGELGKGKNNKEIAQSLFITEGTVKNHLSNIIGKLKLRDRTQAAIFAVRYKVSN